MSTPELKPEQWTYSQYRATLRKDGNFFAIVTPNGRDALSETAANELLALLNRHNPAESALNAAREAIEKAPHADECDNEYVMTLHDGVYGEHHRCTCWKAEALAQIDAVTKATV